MIRLVVCNVSFAGWTANALKRARAATRYGYKKCWNHNVIGNWQCARFIEKTYKKPYAILSFSGPEDEYLVFKLAEDTGLVKTQIEIDNGPSNHLWNELITNDIRHTIHLRDLYEKRIPSYIIHPVLSKDTEALGQCLFKMLEPILDKISR